MSGDSTSLFDQTALRHLVLEDLEKALLPWFLEDEKRTNEIWIDSGGYRLMKSMDNYLDTLSPCTDLVVDDMARELGVSRRTVFNISRKLLGMGPKAYLDLRRLHELRARLRQQKGGKNSVTGIASELGFSDLGRMAGRYREHFGELPSETLKNDSDC